MNEELLPTEYVEDGYVYEVEYKQSAVLQRLTEMLKEGREGFIKRMWMIHDLTDMANSAVKNARKASPLGLVDKCVEKRIDGKQTMICVCNGGFYGGYVAAELHRHNQRHF